MNIQGIKYCLTMLIVLSSIFFSAIALSQESEDDRATFISRVDHENYQLLIGDKLYVMPITLKVYIFDLSTRQKKKVNRYALREGLAVSFKKTIRNRQAYVEEITIYKY